MSEAVKAAKRFCKKHVFTERMHSEVGVYLRTEDWNEDDSHPNLTCQPIDLCVLVFKLCILCAITAACLYLTSFSRVQTQGRLLPLSSLLMHLEVR